MPPRVEPRLRHAIDASVGWYEDICALHGVDSRLEGGLWSSMGSPPPLHSDAVVVEPGVTGAAVLERLDGRLHAGVKDSFASIDELAGSMDLLFGATWIHRAPDEAAQPRATTWSTVRTADELARLTALHDTTDVLLPPLLGRGHFRFLARHEAGEIVAGAVARLGSGVVDVSNVFAVPGHTVSWTELAQEIHAAFPGRPIVGFESGEALEEALGAGFAPVGELRVWVR